MRHSILRLLSIVFAALTFMLGYSSAHAQPDVSAPQESASSIKAQRKVARKEARARKNAQLKTLEDAGYNPATSNPGEYPKNIQDAEKKAAEAPAATSH